MRVQSTLVTSVLVLVAACSSSSPSGSTIGTTSGGTPVDAGGSDAAKPADASSTALATSLSGNLGVLGAAKPTASSLWISTKGGTFIYLSSAQLTCEQVKTLGWLTTVTAGAQVVEVVGVGAPAVGMLAVPPAQVNYAEGGKPSTNEVGATSGSVTFTKAEPTGVIEGTFTASFDGGDTIQGTFHAAFCAGGQDF